MIDRFANIRVLSKSLFILSVGYFVWVFSLLFLMGTPYYPELVECIPILEVKRTIGIAGVILFICASAYIYLLKFQLVKYETVVKNM